MSVRKTLVQYTFNVLNNDQTSFILIYKFTMPLSYCHNTCDCNVQFPGIADIKQWGFLEACYFVIGPVRNP